MREVIQILKHTYSKCTYLLPIYHYPTVIIEILWQKYLRCWWSGPRCNELVDMASGIMDTQLHQTTGIFFTIAYICCCCRLDFLNFSQQQQPDLYVVTLQKFGMCGEINCLEKCFKICHILYIRKPKVALPIFHFVLGPFFPLWMPWSMNPKLLYPFFISCLDLFFPLWMPWSMST